MVEFGIKRRSKKEAYEPSDTGPKRYIFRGELFDSQYELVVYMYCIYNNIPIYRNQRNIGFKYTDSRGKSRTVYPDFIINGNFVEIKGAQFFKPDGTMFLPYRKPEWSDEEYAYQSDIYTRKQKCLLDNGCRIMKSTDMWVQTCLQYINTMYNSNGDYDSWYDIYCKPNINHNTLSFGFTPYNSNLEGVTTRVNSAYTNKEYVINDTSFYTPFDK